MMNDGHGYMKQTQKCFENCFEGRPGMNKIHLHLEFKINAPEHCHDTRKRQITETLARVKIFKRDMALML
jgi:hypothetical protein